MRQKWIGNLHNQMNWKKSAPKECHATQSMVIATQSMVIATQSVVIATQSVVFVLSDDANRMSIQNHYSHQSSTTSKPRDEKKRWKIAHSFFGRGHPAMLVGPSPLAFLALSGCFCFTIPAQILVISNTAAAHPQATWVDVYPALFSSDLINNFFQGLPLAAWSDRPRLLSCIHL